MRFTSSIWTSGGQSRLCDDLWAGKGAGHDCRRNGHGTTRAAQFLCRNVVPHRAVGSVLVHIRAHLRCPYCLRNAPQTQVWTLLLDSYSGHGRSVAGDQRSHQQRRHCVRVPDVRSTDVAHLRHAVGRRTNGSLRLHWFHTNIGHTLVERWDARPIGPTTSYRIRRSSNSLYWPLGCQPKMCTVFIKLILSI